MISNNNNRNRNMKNPSRFGKQKFPEIHYNSNEFLNLKLHNERYHISKTIGRQQSTYFHLGLDIFQKKEVIILRTLTTKYIKRTKQQNQALKSVCLDISWIGDQRINGISYVFEVVAKKGCFLYEYLKTIQQIQIKQFYTILSLLMQFLKRLHKKNINIRQIDIKTLQICINSQTKQPQIMQANRQSISFGQSPNQPKRKSKNENNILPIDKNLIKHNWLQKMNSKPSQKQDMKIMFQKIRQIEIYLQRKLSISDVSGNCYGKGGTVFSYCFKQMLMFIQEQSLELEHVETWLYCVGYFAHHRLKTNVDGLKQPLLNIIDEATLLNRIRIQKYLQQMNEQGDIDDIYSDQLTIDEDTDYQEFTSHLEVQQKISQYRLMPNTKFITNMP